MPKSIALEHQEKYKKLKKKWNRLHLFSIILLWINAVAFFFVFGTVIHKFTSFFVIVVFILTWIMSVWYPTYAIKKSIPSCCFSCGRHCPLRNDIIKTFGKHDLRMFATICSDYMTKSEYRNYLKLEELDKLLIRENDIDERIAAKMGVPHETIKW